MGTSLNIAAWSTTAATNDGADSTIGTVANTSAPNVVDDWVKGIMASVKRYVLDTDGGITAGGTANALTITTNRAISSGHQAAGFSVRFKAANTNTGAATVAVDGLTAVDIKRMNGDALVASDIIAGGIYDIAFDGTNYILMGANPASGSFGALAGDNTWSGVNTFTGAVHIGNADTTLSRASAGVLAVEGKNIYMVGGADVAVADGGTGQSTAALGYKALSDGIPGEGFTIVPTSDHITVQDVSGGTYGKFDIDDFILAVAAINTGAFVGTPYLLCRDSNGLRWVNANHTGIGP